MDLSKIENGKLFCPPFSQLSINLKTYFYGETTNRKFSK